MKLKSTTLALMAGAAAVSTVAIADRVAPAAPAPKQQKPPANCLAAPPQLKAIFAQADKNKDGVLTFNEFKKAYPVLEREILAARNRKNPRPLPRHPCIGCGRG